MLLHEYKNVRKYIINTTTLAKKIRLHAVTMTHKGNSTHIASALSIADILAVLYGAVLTVDPKNPKLATRDRFILSKGHAGSAVYATLAECGFFSTKILETHCQNSSILSGHVSHKGVPGVEISTGSLGHGLPIATGMALAAKRDQKTYKVFVLVGDGECEEGSNWEAIMFAAHHKLDNLTVLVDRNKIQCIDTVENVIDLEPFTAKWQSFGWKVQEVDGHDHNELIKALTNTPTTINKPTCIIANTIKGKGVSFMENSVLWHNTSPQGNDYIQAIEELNRNL